MGGLTTEKFESLFRDWIREMGTTSDPYVLVECPACRDLIGYGREALPYIYHKLKTDHPMAGLFFWILPRMTQANLNNTLLIYLAGGGIKRRWLRWLEQNGYCILPGEGRS